MKISDKELDDLFQSKLNNLEVEPDAIVWNNIDANLVVKPKKKSIVPALRIAASVILVLSVGLLLLQKEVEPVKNKIPQKGVKLKLKQQETVINPNESIVAAKGMLLLTAKNKVVKEAHAKKVNKVLSSEATIQSKEKQDDLSTQTLAQNKTQQDLESIQVASNNMATVPDLATKLNVQPENETPETAVIKPQIVPVERSIVATATKRKGIRNMGDLVNLVMSKVDKRPNKLIEFTDTDDGDESNVTGINLGIISIKKEK